MGAHLLQGGQGEYDYFQKIIAYTYAYVRARTYVAWRCSTRRLYLSGEEMRIIFEGGKRGAALSLLKRRRRERAARNRIIWPHYICFCRGNLIAISRLYLTRKHGSFSRQTIESTVSGLPPSQWSPIIVRTSIASNGESIYRLRSGMN